MKNVCQRLAETLAKIDRGGGYIWIDAYNKVYQREIVGTVTARVGASNMYYILEDEPSEKDNSCG